MTFSHACRGAGRICSRPGEIDMTDAASKPWPTELRLSKGGKALTIAFDSGETFELGAEYLRVKSPSAEVQGHSEEERKTVPGKRNVEIIEVLPVAIMPC